MGSYIYLPIVRSLIEFRQKAALLVQIVNEQVKLVFLIYFYFFGFSFSSGEISISFG